MDDHRDVGPPDLAHEAVQASRVVEVTVAQHDRLDVAGRQLEEAHVVNEAVRADAGVEQHAARSTAGREGDERREAVLTAELLDDLAPLERARSLAGSRG